MIENIISVKKLVLLPFLVFGQFIVNAQKPTQKAQHVITLNLLPAGPIHLPKKEKGNNGNGKDKNQVTESKVELSQDKQSLTITQVIETVAEDKNAAKPRSVIYTVTSL
jgi:hypothetical protein